MSEDEAWDDDARNRLFETLKRYILGEVRLARRTDEEIFENCRAVYIQDDCPDEEAFEFVNFASDELNVVKRGVESEMAGWPQETDCDRLDRVERALQERGIALWQASPCCDTCTMSEFRERIDIIESRCAGFRERLRGYSFFIDQNLPEQLAESRDISVYLAYGWVSPDGQDIEHDLYEQRALGIGRDVCAALHDEGFEPSWNGDFDKKILVSINWQRRSLLD
jgi:hypothetical protein